MTDRWWPQQGVLNPRDVRRAGGWLRVLAWNCPLSRRSGFQLVHQDADLVVWVTQERFFRSLVAQARGAHPGKSFRIWTMGLRWPCLLRWAWSVMFAPGVDPPSHNDIFILEDLEQLIYDHECSSPHPRGVRKPHTRQAFSPGSRALPKLRRASVYHVLPVSLLNVSASKSGCSLSS